MNIFPRKRLVCALFLILVLESCNLPAATPAEPVQTMQVMVSPAPTGNLTPSIPITGIDVVSLQCQFCVHNETHAILIMSNQASFSVAEPANGITCASAKEIDGRRILLCRGPQQASFTLNVCMDASNCLQFPVTLELCPIIPQTGSGGTGPIVTFTPRAPVLLTPIAPAPTDPATAMPDNTESVPPPPATEPPLPAPTDTGGNEKKGDVVICHIPPGNPDQRKTMSVSQSAWDNEHSRHGDTLGAC